MDLLWQLVDFIEPFLWGWMLTGIIGSIGMIWEANEVAQKLSGISFFVFYSIFFSFMFGLVSFFIWIILSIIPWDMSNIKRVVYSGMIGFPILFYYLGRYTKK